MNSNGGEASPAAQPPTSPTKAALAEAVKAQGDVVRKLKEEKADKSKVGEQIGTFFPLKKVHVWGRACEKIEEELSSTVVSMNWVKGQ